MSRSYVRITEEKFDEFIDGLVPSAEKKRVRGAKEVVYDLPLPRDGLSIKVFSTIQGGRGRDRGDDAIRCVIWDHGADAPVGGREKTLRIRTWRENLADKIRYLYRNWRDHDHGPCPECGRGVLVERTPGPSDDWDPFLACSEWNGGDGCDHTERL